MRLEASDNATLRDMPSTSEVVAGDVSRLLVVFPGVERTALIGRLLAGVRVNFHVEARRAGTCYRNHSEDGASYWRRSLC